MQRVLILVFFCIALGIYFVFFFVTPVEVTPAFRQTIGTSVEGRSIKAFTYGRGENHIVIVGGLHGGYEWNTSKLAYELIEYFDENIQSIPSSVSLTIIPVANPDGLFAVLGTTTDLENIAVPQDPKLIQQGRFNANDVDLNRNFDCKWQRYSPWGEHTVDAGSAPFSEPESEALRLVVNSKAPDAFIFFHSEGNAVYGAECHDGILEETKTVLGTYAKASGYDAFELFDAYPITGDAESWLSSLGIPALTVELSSHEDTDLEKNIRGVEAVMEFYARR